jgi:V/A-type H+/Na+-transporting ATPase subunit D
MLSAVSANRMVLARLRKRLGTAQRGHSLMKRKQEELVHRFRAAALEIGRLRGEVDVRLPEAYAIYLLGHDQLPHGADPPAFPSAPPVRVAVNRSPRRVLNLTASRSEVDAAISLPPFGLAYTNTDLDASVLKLRTLLPVMIDLADRLQEMYLIRGEIIRTRRRVNALEYVLIPQIERDIKAVQMKLDEMERSNLSRLMRIKTVVRRQPDEAPVV